MTFDFQELKPLIQAEFDAVLAGYPTELGHLWKDVPVGGDGFDRKARLIEAALEGCPLRLVGHYPFLAGIDIGLPRDSGMGLRTLALEKSGVDFGELEEFKSGLLELGLGSFNDYTDHEHRTLDHEKLLSEGYRGIYEECVRLNALETDPGKKHWRECVMRVCKAVEAAGLRIRAEAAELLKSAQDEDVRRNMQRLASCANVPWEPAGTMFEALESILCATLYVCKVDSLECLSFGPLDRLMLPYYERDLAQGRITREEAEFLIRSFLARVDLHSHYNAERTYYDQGATVQPGGCDPEGNPVYNEITDMILDAFEDNRFIHPKLNCRAGSYSPQAYLERLAKLIRLGNNNLVIENDDYIVPMFLRMGLAPEDARRYVGNGCQEVTCPNQMHSRAFVYMNTVRVLLDTLKYSFSGERPEGVLARVYQYGSFCADTFDDLYRSYLANLRSYIRTVTESFHPYERIHHRILPELLLSPFTGDCVQRGLDNSQGGARYYHKTLSLVGFGTLADSMLALRRAYDDGSVRQLLAAMDADFEGCEPLRRALENHSDRFGHSDSADAFARSLAGDLAQVSRGVYSAYGVEWCTSLFTYWLYREFGYRTGATPDGRHAGTPMSRQMNMARLPVLTAAALSLSAVTDADFHDVCMFDFALPWSPDAHPLQKTLASFIRTCLELKIPVLQPNVADRATLVEERDHPGTHPGLVVRVCGYSALFTDLPRNMQDELIARAGD